jgi:hypothetical protein
MRHPGVRSDDAPDDAAADDLAGIGEDVPAAGAVSFETAPLARQRRTVPPAAVVLVMAAVLAVAVAKPWGDGTTTASPVPVAGIAASAAATGAMDSSPFARLVGGPVDGPQSRTAVPAPETFAVIVTQLAADAGEWGIGVGGSGPRLSRDEPWTEWQPIDPVAGAPYPRDLLRWPGTDLCLGVPRLYDGPSLLAVTVPPGLRPDWRILSWRSDGTTISSLSTTLHQVSPPGNRQISYLEYPDNARWPQGRYEFHVVSGDHVVAMTICLVRNL